MSSFQLVSIADANYLNSINELTSIIANAFKNGSEITQTGDNIKITNSVAKSITNAVLATTNGNEQIRKAVQQVVDLDANTIMSYQNNQQSIYITSSSSGTPNIFRN